MATLLYRLGRFAVRRRRTVVAIWLLILVGVGFSASAFSGQTSDRFSIPGTESQRAIDLLQQRFPGAGGASSRVVFAAPAGQTLQNPSAMAAVDDTVARLQHAPQVSDATDPFTSGTVSDDGTVAYAEVHYPVQSTEVDDASVDALEQAVEPARHAGLTVEFGGDVHPGNSDEGGSSELIGLLIAVVVLLISFGSLIAAGLPILTAMIGVGTGIAGITALSGVISLSSTAPTLATMIGLAVGIDYALFIVSRHRQNLADGLAPEEAAARAAATAGSAVVFAGLTVIIALAGLSVVGIPFLTVMALAAAATVAIAVLIALTLLPALLGFAGTTIDRLKVPGLRVHRAGDAHNGFGTRWARAVVRRPVAVLVIGVVCLGAIASPVLSLDLGLPSDATASTNLTQRRAYDLLARGFGPGFNGPLTIVVDSTHAANPTEATQDVRSALAHVPGVVEVSKPNFNKPGDTATMSVIPSTGPSTVATNDLVHTIRHRASSLDATTHTTVSVTGTTALNIDVSAKLGDALPVFLVVVVGLALILLTLVFRSVVVPVKAALGFLLTIAASFGAVVAIFQWGWLKALFGVHSTGPIVSFLPILLMAVLFGLAMDYEVFLVSRMREDFVHGAEPRHAIIAGFTGGARVVTAAALIMASVFAAFMLGDDPIIKSMGFALAFGVLVDAFVVRMTLVPAVMALFDRRAWWLPGWLERLMPNVDIEGAGLAQHLRPDDSPSPRAASDSSANEHRTLEGSSVGD